MKNQIRKIILLSFAMLIMTGCGFKTLNDSFSNQVKVIDIKSEGESRINIKIKDQLFLRSNNKGNKSINIFFKTLKEKTIAEKNSSNKITKYRINIKTEVKYNETTNQIENTFTISENRVYTVTDNNLVNFESEKRTIDTLTKVIAKEIYSILQLNFNDI